MVLEKAVMCRSLCSGSLPFDFCGPPTESLPEYGDLHGVIIEGQGPPT